MALRYDDLYEITRNQQELITWLRHHKLLGKFAGPCINCQGGYLSQRRDKSYKDGVIFACSKRGDPNKRCYCKLSIRCNSWFAKSHLSLKDIVKLTYYWVHDTANFRTKYELHIGSDHTIVDWYNFCREVCVEVLIKDSELIGGPGIVVEIDESKFGKRKYNRGKRVEGCWVFGGIERGTGRCFFTRVADRSAETLIPIIQAHIAPGSTIISDCWKAYSKLSELGYVHQTVNHSKTFKDKITGACTNTIEGQWHLLKSSLPTNGTSKTLLDSYFAEYCVRSKYLRHSDDKFLGFLKLVRKVYTCQRPESANKENVLPVEATTIVQTNTTPTPPSTPSPIKEEHNYSLPLYSDDEMEISFNESMDLFD